MNSFQGVRKKRKLPKIISAAEAESLLNAAERDGARAVGPEVGFRNRLMIAMMYRAGLRVSEVVVVKQRDIGNDGLIHLYDAKGGDGTAYFDPGTINPLLSRWLHIRDDWINWNGMPYHGGSSLPLFLNKNGSPVSVRYLQRLVKRLKEELGIMGIVTPHVFRHTYATELIEEGMPIHEVQGAMRHANLQTTAIYLSIRDESIRRHVSRRSSGGGEIHEDSS